jgi:hypothetical protein
LVAFGLASYADSVFGDSPTTAEGAIVEAVVWGFVFIPLYGWIANNIDVAISADYFNRDAIGWRRGGKVLAIVGVLGGYALASIPSWWLPEVSSSLGLGLVDAFFAVAVSYSAAVLAITYFRIQDMRIRNYTKWVVLSFVGLFLMILVPAGLLIVAAAVWAGFMYLSAGALAIRTKTLPV